MNLSGLCMLSSGPAVPPLAHSRCSNEFKSGQVKSLQGVKQVREKSLLELRTFLVQVGVFKMDEWMP